MSDQDIIAAVKSSARILSPSFEVDAGEIPMWNPSYSMFGEDLILRGLLKSHLRSGKPGFFVDIGACDPRYGNNSYLFYKYGWRGICVDVDARLAMMFTAWRPRDVFIAGAVGSAGKGYFAASTQYPALNRIGMTPDEFGEGYKPAVPIDFLPLKTIFDQHVPAGTQIDFMSMDIEDSELSALKSNDWSKYKPRIIIIETHNINASNIHESAVLNYLKDLGYIVEGIVSGNALLLLP